MTGSDRPRPERPRDLRRHRDRDGEPGPGASEPASPATSSTSRNQNDARLRVQPHRAAREALLEQLRGLGRLHVRPLVRRVGPDLLGRVLELVVRPLATPAARTRRSSRPSKWDAPHRFVVSGEYTLPTKTDVSLTWIGESGVPFEYVYGSDMNGDNSTSNDLLYVPKNAHDTTQIRFTAERHALTPASRRTLLENFISEPRLPQLAARHDHEAQLLPHAVGQGREPVGSSDAADDSGQELHPPARHLQLPQPAQQELGLARLRQLEQPGPPHPPVVRCRRAGSAGQDRQRRAAGVHLQHREPVHRRRTCRRTTRCSSSSSIRSRRHAVLPCSEAGAPLGTPAFVSRIRPGFTVHQSAVTSINSDNRPLRPNNRPLLQTIVHYPGHPTSSITLRRSSITLRRSSITPPTLDVQTIVHYPPTIVHHPQRIVRHSSVSVHYRLTHSHFTLAKRRRRSHSPHCSLRIGRRWSRRAHRRAKSALLTSRDRRRTSGRRLQRPEWRWTQFDRRITGAATSIAALRSDLAAAASLSHRLKTHSNSTRTRLLTAPA